MCGNNTFKVLEIDVLHFQEKGLSLGWEIQIPKWDVTGLLHPYMYIFKQSLGI
jgi:hypothetical protein